MYIASAYNVLHDYWRYLIGIGVVIAGIFVFSIPHLAAVFMKTFDGSADMSKLEDTNYLMNLFEPNLNLVFILLPFAGGLLFLVLIAKLLHKQSFKQLTTSRDKIDWSRFWFALIFWGIVSSSLIAVDYFSNPEHYQDNFNLQPFLILCVIAVILVPLQTSFEEYFFRGYLMQGIGVWSENKRFPFVFCYLVIAITSYVLLTKYFDLGILLKLLLIIIKIGIFFFLNSDFFLNTFIESKWYNVFYKLLNRTSTPLLFTSASFGLLHIANPEIEKLGYILLVYYIGTGLFLGIITLMDDGLELALGFHLANNLFTALLVTADWTAFQTHSIFKDVSEPTEAGFFDVFMPVFIIFPIVLFVFAKKYKWTNWKEKLFGRVEKPIEDYKILED